MQVNLPDDTGVPHEKVKASCWLNLDEEGLQASAGIVTVVGAAGNKKHEKIQGDRASIAVCKSGNAAGESGPWFFLMQGKEMRPGFTDEFLTSHGAPAGSRIIMTESGYMTDAAFDEIATNLASGIRSMPVIKDHPSWHVLLSSDGFHAHKFAVAAQRKLLEARILHLIEEGDSSHACQACDRFVAKCGKASMREVLDLVMRHRVFGTHMDQWDLLLVALHCSKVLAKRKDVWRDSFKAVNMHPDHRVGVEEWLIKIADFIAAGSAFVDEGKITVMDVLPKWCRNWSRTKQAAAKAIVDAGSGKAGVSVWQCPETMLKLQEATCLSLKELHGCQAMIFGLETMGGPEKGAPREAADFALRVTSGTANICLFDALQLAGLPPLQGMSVPQLCEHRRACARQIKDEICPQPRRSVRNAQGAALELSPAQRELLQGAEDMSLGGMTSAAVIEHMAEVGILHAAGKTLRVHEVVAPGAAPPAEAFTVVDPGDGRVANVELVHQAGGDSIGAARVHPRCSATVCQLDLPPITCAERRLPDAVHHMCLHADVEALGAGDNFPAFRHVCVHCLRESVGQPRQLLAAPDGNGDIIHSLWGGCADPMVAGPVVHFSYLEPGDHAVAVQTVEPGTLSTQTSSSVHAENVADAATTGKRAVVDNGVNLRSHALHPKDKTGAPLFKGEELFAHMISLRNRTWQEPKRQRSWGAGAVDFQITDEQRSVLQPTQDELMEGAILKEIGVAKCSRRMARRRMNNMGEANDHSVWANDPQRIERMQNALDLAVTLGDMNEARAKTKVYKGCGDAGEGAGAPIPPRQRHQQAARRWRGRRREPHCQADLLRALA